MDDERLARVEAHLAIQQLAVRYAMAIDARDLDLLAEQWAPDVWMGRRHGQGRDAVRRYFEPILQRFYRSIHMVVGHRIDVIDAECATGSVYCRAEHESGSDWVVQAIVYDDTYRLVDGAWGFVKRTHRHWYSAPITEAPTPPTFERWPGYPGPLPDLPHAWPSWDRYWSAVDDDTVARITRRPGPAG
ncbi:MAG TPA: nuclear transport factor 2 family protein [Acidimicrobiales bacterium]|nr:nuclear transport factor 2 family protein [Acidimicrobiales bacterium]